MNTIKLEAKKWTAHQVMTYTHKKLKPITIVETYKWATWTWEGDEQDLEYEVHALNDIDLHGDQEHELNSDWELYSADTGDYSVNYESALTDRKWKNALEKNDHNPYEALNSLGYEYDDGTTYLSETPHILEELFIEHPTHRVHVDLNYLRPQYEQYGDQELVVDLLSDNYTHKTQDALVREHLREYYQIELPQEYIHEITINNDDKSIRISHYQVYEAYDQLNTIVSQNNSNSPRVYEQSLDTALKLGAALKQIR